MKILAFDTSSSYCSVALNDKMWHQHAPMQQAQLLLPMIDEGLRSENINKNQLDAIAFGCGPGSFTGIRIATSIAQGLGYALNIPLIPVSSLAGLAQAACNHHGWQKIAVAVDARMQEIYYAQYQVNADGLVELVGKEQLCAPEKIVPCGSEWHGVGDAWEAYANRLPYQPSIIDAKLGAEAIAIIQLAIQRAKNKQWMAAHEALPIYLRDEVAIKEEKR